MKLKKLLSFVMAGMCVSTLTAPATAANVTKISAVCRLPEIKVTVPSTGRVYINPYKIPVNIGASENSGQIISLPASIANNSEVPIEVNVTVTGKPKSGSTLTLSQTSTKDSDETSKKVFLYFEMQATDPGTDLTTLTWDSAYNADKHVIINGQKKDNIVKLSAAENGKATEGGIGAFHIAGDAVQSPENEWNDTDGVDVDIAFTFTPLSLQG